MRLGQGPASLGMQPQGAATLVPPRPSGLQAAPGASPPAEQETPFASAGAGAGFG